MYLTPSYISLLKPILLGKKLILFHMSVQDYQSFDLDTVNPFPNRPWFLCVCSTSLLKTLQEKEKLLVTRNFSFAHSVFYPSKELSAIFIKTEFVV